MAQRRITFIASIAALVVLGLPAVAMAQYRGNDPSYGRGRYDDRYDRYNERRLRESVRRVTDRSRDFQRNLDRALDRSRYDNTRREDRINDTLAEFRNAAIALKDRTDDGRNINRGTSEARRLLQLGSRIDRFVSRTRLDWRVTSDWSDIRQNLRVIADVYNLRMGDFDGGYRRDDDYRRPDN